MYFRNLLIISVLFVCQSFTLGDFTIELQEFKEVIEKDYNFSTNEPEIIISNRYGNIDITTTEGNTASVEITIVVEARNKSNADKIMDRIDISFTDTNTSMKAVTRIDSKNGWNITKRNESYQIHYLVKLPKSSYLSVENKYGDIAITDLNNDLDVELKYGSGQIQDVDGNVSLDLGYSDQFLIGNISGDAALEIEYSNFQMQDAQKIELESKYSEIEIRDAVRLESETKYDEIVINKVGTLDNEGKYDKIDIGMVDKFRIETKYTNIDIGTLNETAILYTGYGKVYIEEVTTGFDEIEIESKYTGFQFNVNGGYQLQVDSEHTSVSYPDDLDIDYRDNDKNDLKLKGTQPGSGNGNISAQMKYGKLRIRD